MRFRDKVVVVTGAAGGIGRGAANAFAAEGAALVLTDTDESGLADAVQQISNAGSSVLGLAGDVCDEGVVDRHAAQALDRFGRIDVLVNNAGIMRRAPSEELSRAVWRQVIDVNLHGAFYWAQAAARSMIPRRSGSIVNVASIAGLVGIPTAAAYVASKHALVGLTRALAVDWAQYGIRVNALCPGMTWSNLSKADLARNPDMYAVRQQRIPLGKAAEPDEQARAILFLASTEASYVHGLIMNVDGGQLALSSGHSAPRPA